MEKNEHTNFQRSSLKEKQKPQKLPQNANQKKDLQSLLTPFFTEASSILQCVNN